MKKIIDKIKNFFRNLCKKKTFICAKCGKTCPTTDAVKVKDKQYCGYYDENVSETIITICKDCYLET